MADEGMFSGGVAAGAALIDGVLTNANETHLAAAVPANFVALHFVSVLDPKAWSTPSALLGGVPIASQRIVQSQAESRTGDWVDTSGALFRAYDAFDGATYVIRPDGHVMMRSRSVEVALSWPFPVPTLLCAAIG